MTKWIGAAILALTIMLGSSAAINPAAAVTADFENGSPAVARVHVAASRVHLKSRGAHSLRDPIILSCPMTTVTAHTFP